MTDEHQAYIQLHDALIERGALTSKAVDDYFPIGYEGKGEQGSWSNDTDVATLTPADHRAAELMDLLERWRATIMAKYRTYDA